MKRIRMRTAALTLAAAVLWGVIPAAAETVEFTEVKTPTPTEEQAELFRAVAVHAAMYGTDGGYFESGQPVEAAVACNYLADCVLSRPAYEKYAVEGMGYGRTYRLPYEDYMALADDTFAHHGNLKEQLAKESAYDAETGMVTVITPMAGGDCWDWVPLSVYEEGDACYVQGLYLYGMEEDPAEDGEYRSWYSVSGVSMDVDESGEIVETPYEQTMHIEAYTELKLTKNGDGWIVDGYYPIDYCIGAKGDSAALYTEQGEIYYPVTVQCIWQDAETGRKTAMEPSNLILKQNGVRYQDTLTAFRHNGRLWRKNGDPVELTVRSAVAGCTNMDVYYENCNHSGGFMDETEDGVYYLSDDTVEEFYLRVVLWGGELPQAAFSDVNADSWFCNPVRWAVANKVTVGISATEFAPDAVCTRAEVVQFLYNQAGKPAVSKGARFADVPAGAWYADAVSWAAENDITGGTGAGCFSPDAVCTRAQAVQLLYNGAGKPDVEQTDKFTDVPADKWYATAVAWAVENKVTAGTSERTFSPEADCTRAQTVTLLYNHAVQ